MIPRGSILERTADSIPDWFSVRQRSWVQEMEPAARWGRYVKFIAKRIRSPLHECDRFGE